MVVVFSVCIVKRGAVGGVLDVCLCFGCGGMGDVGGKWVGGIDQGLEGWCGVMYV